jgi:hypothetical protein
MDCATFLNSSALKAPFQEASRQKDSDEGNHDRKISRNMVLAMHVSHATTYYFVIHVISLTVRNVTSLKKMQCVGDA